MFFIFGVLLRMLFITAVVSQSLREVRWLPCQFIDEHDEIMEEMFRGTKMSLPNTKYVHRDAGLQFGLPGDSPVHSDLITFLVTASKVDMRQHLKGGVDSVHCEIRRHRTSSNQERWPGMGAQKQDNWFACTLHHSEALSVITTFLRHTPSNSSAMQPEFSHFITVADRDTISTTAAMMVLSNTSAVYVGPGKEQTLNCEFAVDHKSAHLTVEWHLQPKGHRSKVFSYSSRTGQSQGRGVSLKAIAKGDASLKIPLTKQSSEGTYTCSVHVPPLTGSQSIALHVMKPPRVSLNVNSEVSATVDEKQRVSCNAESYYPLDVHMEWLREFSDPGLNHKPVVLEYVQFSSHRSNPDDTYSLSASFVLTPTLQDSGYRYTCRVSHAALQEPILESFTLTVAEKDSFLWYIPPILTVLGILYLLLSRQKAVTHQRHIRGIHPPRTRGRSYV